MLLFLILWSKFDFFLPDIALLIFPSAFIAIDPVTEDGEDAFLITGGGYGHGLGMSQNGANTMAKEGKSFLSLLLLYR